MKKYVVASVAFVLVIAAGIGYRIASTKHPNAIDAANDAMSQPAVVEPKIFPTTSDHNAIAKAQQPAAEKEQVAESPDQKLIDMGFTAEEITKRRRIQALQAAADQRFNEVVEVDNLQAQQVHPQVRALFKTLSLKPVYNADETNDGYIDGMKIVELAYDSPFTKAGFKIGDKLTSVNGQLLNDPAQIAHLFADLGTHFDVCAERDGGEQCRTITLPNGKG